MSSGSVFSKAGLPSDLDENRPVLYFNIEGLERFHRRWILDLPRLQAELGKVQRAYHPVLEHEADRKVSLLVSACAADCRDFAADPGDKEMDAPDVGGGEGPLRKVAVLHCRHPIP